MLILSKNIHLQEEMPSHTQLFDMSFLGGSITIIQPQVNGSEAVVPQ